MANSQQSQSHIKFPQSIPDTARHSTLTTEILPLFDVRRWEHVEAQEYCAMVPALRLASLLLTHPKIAGFWHTQYFGARTRDFDEVRDKWNTRIREPVPWTKEGETKLKKVLNGMATRIRYQFLTMKRNVYGSCIERQRGDYCIRLNQQFSSAARAIQICQPKAKGFSLRFNLIFAVTVVHEIAHAIDFSFAGHYPCGTLSDEALHGEQRMGHSGFVWERQVFGGAVSTIDEALDGKGGIVLLRDFFDDKPIPGGRKIRIGMVKVWMLQQKGFWHDTDFRFDLHEMLREEISTSQINVIFDKQRKMDFREMKSLKRKRPVAQHGTEGSVPKSVKFTPAWRRVGFALDREKQDDVLEDADMDDVDAGRE